MQAHALSSFGLRFSRALLLAGLILFSFANARATASEIIVKTDSIEPGSPLVFQDGIPAGRFGNVLTAPVDGTIVGVQIWWGSRNGGTPPAQQPAIRISTASFNPFLSLTQLAQINSPTLVDGALNEYRFTDPGTNLVPLSLPITAGTEFFVDLEVVPVPEQNQNPPFILIERPGEFTSLDNFAKLTSSTNWFPFTLGISSAGDFGIRAIIQPVPEPSTYVMGAMGIVALLALRWRRVSA